MKLPWTRIVSLVLKKVETETERQHLFRWMFMRHHKNACELVVAKDGAPLAAIYFTPDAKHRQKFKAIMRTIQERTLFNNEILHDDLNEMN